MAGGQSVLVLGSPAVTGCKTCDPFGADDPDVPGNQKPKGAEEEQQRQVVFTQVMLEKTRSYLPQYLLHAPHEP